MKRRFSLSRWMHNDKLMLIVSLVLAIVIWSVVVYGPSNAQDQVITGVPISVTLNDYASQTLNLRVTSGGSAVATVKVHGLRSVVSKLSAADITVTADTGNVISEGTYTLPLRAVSSGDYSIVSVVGEDGTNSTVTVTCDVWKEASFPVSVEMPNLSVLDEQTMQFGTPVVNGEAISAGKIIVSGSRTNVAKIDKVVAVIDEAAVVEAANNYTARLEARDANRRVLEEISFSNAEDGTVGVTVPVMVYRKIQLSPTLSHIPADYQSRKNLISVSPSALEIWGVPSEIDEYAASVQRLLQLDFDRLSADNLTQVLSLPTVDGIRPVNGDTKLTVKVNLSGITTKKLDLTLNDSTVQFTNVPVGYTVKCGQSALTGITICGPSRSLSRVKATNLRLSVNLSGVSSTGKQTVTARVSVVGYDDVWVCYEKEKDGIDLVVSVEQS